MRFVKVTAWIWLGLISAGLALSVFGLQKQPIMFALVLGSTLGYVLAAKLISADPGYAVKANIVAMIPTIIILVVALSPYE